MAASRTENHPFPLCKLLCSCSMPLEYFFSLTIWVFFPFLSHPYLSPAGMYCTYINWFGFLYLKASFQVFIVRAARERSCAISVMPLLLQPNNCRTYCNCIAGIHVYLRSSMMFDFSSVTGIQITVNCLQDLLFCWRSLLCQSSILSLLGA